LKHVETKGQNNNLISSVPFENREKKQVPTVPQQAVAAFFGQAIQREAAGGASPSSQKRLGLNQTPNETLW